MRERRVRLKGCAPEGGYRWSSRSARGAEDAAKCASSRSESGRGKRYATRTSYNAHADSIPLEYGVIGQKRERFGDALGDQQTVERISMNG